MSGSDDKKRERSWLNFVAPIGLWKVGRDTAQSVRETFRGAQETLKGVGAERPIVLRDWNMAIRALGVTEDRVRREVSRRQVMACAAAVFFCIGFYGLFVWKALLPGIGCALLSCLYYLQASLRLHQLRHRDFVSVREFLNRVSREPRELLPLGLPPGWVLFKRETK